MKKFFVTLILAAMILSTGCGNKSETPAPPEQKPAASTSTQPANSPDAKFSVGGILPGMSLDDAKKLFGEPSATHEDEFTFANGLELELDNGRVADIKIRQAGVSTGAGVAVD